MRRTERKPKWVTATAAPQKQPAAPAKAPKAVKPSKPLKPAQAAKPRNKPQSKRVWLPVLLDYLGNYVLLVLLSGLILWLALIFRGLFDRVA